jgi:ketol-acid reductoisomerase
VRAAQHPIEEVGRQLRAMMPWLRGPKAKAPQTVGTGGGI